jgi:hypothetical protein
MLLAIGIGLGGHFLGERMVSGIPEGTLGESIVLLFCVAPIVGLAGLVVTIVGVIRYTRGRAR